MTLQIGDKIEYDEGTGHTTTPDTTKGAGDNYINGALTTKEYTNEDLEWRFLGLDEYGHLELISTKPTHKIYLYGSNAIYTAELDVFCNNLYGKGIGAYRARSLDKDDLDKLDSGMKIENDTILFSNIINNGEGNTEYQAQWLDSFGDYWGAYWIYCTSNYSYVDFELYDHYDGIGHGDSKRVRPVVTLHSDAKIYDTDNNGIPNVTI